MLQSSVKERNNMSAIREGERVWVYMQILKTDSCIASAWWSASHPHLNNTEASAGSLQTASDHLACVLQVLFLAV
jgi:hypothetical protein